MADTKLEKRLKEIQKRVQEEYGDVASAGTSADLSTQPKPRHGYDGMPGMRNG